jgi:hypothetical protein
VGKFSERDVKDALDKVVSGQLQTHPLDKISFEDRDCTEFYAALVAETEREDDEILRETLEELRRKQEEAGDSTQSSRRGRRKKRSKDEL